MTQDCLDSLSTAGVSQRLPKGIRIIGAEKLSAPKVEGISRRERIFVYPDPSQQPSSWSYLFLQHMAARSFQRWLEDYNADGSHERQPFFVHQSFRYSYKNKETQRGVKKELCPSVSGLVFLQGTVSRLRHFLSDYFPHYHLVNDCSLGSPASIPDEVMRPFMNVMTSHPDQVTFLRDPFVKFAKDHVLLRVLTGPFTGYEGYIVRIDRDRQLVFDLGGYAVALRGVHQEDFEVVE